MSAGSRSAVQAATISPTVPPTHRQHDRFGDRRAREARGAGPERESDRGVVLACDGACKKQVRDVGAREKEQKADARCQHPGQEGRVAAIRTDRAVGHDEHRTRVRRPLQRAAVRVRKSVREPGSERRNFRSRLIDRDAWGESAQKGEPAIAARGGIRLLPSERPPDVRHVAEADSLEIRGRDAGDPHRPAIQSNRRSEDPSRPSQPRPEAMGNRRGVGVAGRGRRPREELRAEHTEIVARHHRDPHACRGVSRRQVGIGRRLRRQRLERVAHRGEVHVVQIRRVAEGPAAEIARVDRHEAARIADAVHRPEEQGVDEAEDDRVRGDPDGERAGGDDAERRRTPEHPRGMAKVGQHARDTIRNACQRVGVSGPASS